jgi:hypothetical protein
MSTRVENLMIELSQDPYRATRFRDNPDAEVAAFGLSTEEAGILISGDLSDIDESLNIRKAASMAEKKPKPKPRPKKKKTGTKKK